MLGYPRESRIDLRLRRVACRGIERQSGCCTSSARWSASGERARWGGVTFSGMDMLLEYSGAASKNCLHLALPPASMRLI